MKQLIFVDYLIIAVYIVASFAIGNYYLKRAGSSLDEYFLSGRRMSWWLIGLSMVATNYAIDYPLAITKLVAKNGIMGTWYVWSLAIAGIATTFFFSRLWRRARVVTDAELIKYRYSGNIGNALRIFKGVYFGVIINCFVLGWIFRALIKVMTVVTPWNQWHILTFFVAVTLIYTITGGLSAVIMTDCVQYVMITISAIVFACYAVAHVGGLTEMVSQIDTLYAGKHYLDFSPGLAGGQVMPWSAFFVYFFIQWWANKYSDGGGKHIQRMSAARNETHSVAGTFLYSILYVLSTWPIILTALCALIVFGKLPDPELGYPRLMTAILPNGVLGLCLVGLLSAFMSTVSTLFNLGPSYLVNDIYKAFFVKHATEKHYILISRFATALIALTGMVLSVHIESIADMWQFVLSFASGAGIVWILRWFWWRINAWSEFSSMICSAVVATYLKECHREIPFENALLIIVAVTIPVFLVVTWLTAPVNDETLRDFYNKVQPGHWGWRRVADKYGITRTPYLTRAFVNFLLGTALLFLINFGVGTLLLRSLWLGVGEILTGGLLALILVNRIQKDDLPPDAAKVAPAGGVENCELANRG
ncbi:MAG: sodium:solute symporter family protein [Verrucomicrobiota bacterium]|jgi:Na+/proline symporter